jgi:hypothetical protein
MQCWIGRDSRRGAQAGYSGPIVVLTYYSLSYSDPAQVAAAQFLDSVIAGVTTLNGGIVADGFAAFQGPSAAFAGGRRAACKAPATPWGRPNGRPHGWC